MRKIRISVRHAPATPFSRVQAAATRKLRKEYRYERAESHGRLSTIPLGDGCESVYLFRIV